MEALAQLSKQELIGLILQLRTVVQEQALALKAAQHEMAALKQEVEALQQQLADPTQAEPPPKPPTPPPDWVKPNSRSSNQDPSGEGKPKKRKKREHNFAWTRREPTKTVEHACDTCPDCGRGLCG